MRSDFQIGNGLGGPFVSVRAEFLLDTTHDPAELLEHLLRCARTAMEPEPPEERQHPQPPVVRSARRAAVYRYFDALGQLVYVGKTVDLAAREKQHRKRPWWITVARREVEWFESEHAALCAEEAAILAEAPLYNRAGVRA